jgi:hypothetical protein
LQAFHENYKFPCKKQHKKSTIYQHYIVEN